MQEEQRDTRQYLIEPETLHKYNLGRASRMGKAGKSGPVEFRRRLCLLTNPSRASRKFGQLFQLLLLDIETLSPFSSSNKQPFLLIPFCLDHGSH